MSLRWRLALVALVIMAASSALAQDEKGWFEGYCDGASFYLRNFAAQTRTQNMTFFFRSPGMPLDFHLFSMGPDWWDVSLCVPNSECDETAKAKMQFLEHGKKHLSGRYVVDFKGEHWEGSFELKERFHKHPVRLCL
jgi:hypothetical protein